MHIVACTDPPDDAGPRKDAADGLLLALAAGLHEAALAAGSADAVEAMAQLVLVPVITHGAQIIVGALPTLPANTCDKQTLIHISKYYLQSG